MGVRDEAQMARGGIMEEVTRQGKDLVRKSRGELKMELIETRPGDELLKPGGQKFIKIETFSNQNTFSQNQTFQSNQNINANAFSQKIFNTHKFSKSPKMFEAKPL